MTSENCITPRETIIYLLKKFKTCIFYYNTVSSTPERIFSICLQAGMLFKYILLLNKYKLTQLIDNESAGP